MKYALKNLASFCKNERMVFLLTILSIFTSMTIILFAMGIYQNYRQELLDKESDTKELNITFSKDESTGEYVTQELLKNSLQELSNTTTSPCYGMIIKEAVEGAEKEDTQNGYDYLTSYLTIDDGEIRRCDEVIDNFINSKLMVSGEWWSEAQEESGGLCAIVAAKDTEHASYSKSAYNDSYLSEDAKTIQLQDRDYQVVATSNFTTSPIVPFLSLDADTEMVEIEISFHYAVSKAQYDDIKNTFEGNMGDLVHMPELTLYDSDNTKLNITVMYISIMIAVLAAINFSILYNYILIQRKRKLTIFQLCGCTRGKVIKMYLLECQMLSIPLLIVAILFYQWILLPRLAKIFPYIRAYYSWQIYVKLSLLCFLVTTSILLIMITRSVTHKIRCGIGK